MHRDASLASSFFFPNKETWCVAGPLIEKLRNRLPYIRRLHRRVDELQHRLAALEAAPSQHPAHGSHLEIASRGYVAVDFYDGSVIYDFERKVTRLIDFDHYRVGPFVLEEDRLPGSSRFMAPEEFERGALIDQRTNVFTLGRCAQEFLGTGSDFRGSAAQWNLVLRATHSRREERFASLADFVAAWRAARSPTFQR